MAGTDPTRPGINAVTGRELEWNPVPAAVNPYYAAYQTNNKDDQQRLIGRTSLQVNLAKNLFFKGTVALNSIYYTESNYVPKTNAFTPLGYFRSGKEQSNKTTFQGILNYNNRFMGDKIGLNLMAGANQEKNDYSSNTANGTQWIVPNLYSITNLVNRDLANASSLSLAGIASDGTNSVFSEANLDYDNVFFLTVTGRNDWFSVLNPGFNSIFYPSIGGMYKGGGGGGAGGVGGLGYDYTSGSGGPGLYSSISGTNTAYAGGGGAGTINEGQTSYGGAGGVGGGGTGGRTNGTQIGTSGTVNTGGGGGGGSSAGVGLGGSGIVIIRYSNTFADAASTTGSPTFTNAGGYKVYKFTIH
jgi:hypothetical protein